jgi:hypothetical protein
MTYAAHHGHFTPYRPDKAFPKSNPITKKPGVLWRIFVAIMDARQKQADRKIARWLGRSGGRITDGIEREMMQSLPGTTITPDVHTKG